jgi:hypothetical protein
MLAAENGALDGFGDENDILLKSCTVSSLVPPKKEQHEQTVAILSIKSSEAISTNSQNGCGGEFCHLKSSHR